MIPGFLILPNCYIAKNAKVASSAIALSVLQTYYPDIMYKVDPINNQTFYPDGHYPTKVLFQARVPKIKSTTLDKDVYLLVRNPVERFVSACCQIKRTDVDNILTEMINVDKVSNDYHMLKQCSYCNCTTAKTIVYKYENIDKFVEAVGLKPLILIHETLEDKPTLTKEQENAINTYYADDMTLYAGAL